MVVGILLIVLLQWMFLGDLRSALIVGATIPFALFFAVIILVLRGESANLLSVGAIDFGLIVDATVIMVEAIFRRLSQTTALSDAEQSHISTDTTMDMKSHAILQRGRRRVAFDLLRRGDHHRRVPAAVHAERRRRQHLRADGADLCLRAGRRLACDLHRHAGAERDHPAGACRTKPRPGSCRSCTGSTCRCCTGRSPTASIVLAGAVGLVVADGCRSAGCSAWNSCRSSRREISGSARRCRRRSRSRRATPTSTRCAR